MESTLQHPFTCIISGPTQSGKSEFVLRLIEQSHALISPPPERITFCYGEYQQIFTKYPYVIFNSGLPDFESLGGVEPSLLIIDDLLSEINSAVSNMFTRGSHHRNISVIFLSQNLFHKSKDFRTMSLNTHYLVLFKSVRDVTQVSTLARQMYPGKSKLLIEAYQDATTNPFGYLLIDMKPQTNDKMRLRTNIFINERQIAYVSK
jgi:hypothetical protein